MKVQQTVVAFLSIGGRFWCTGLISRCMSLIFSTIKNVDIQEKNQKDKVSIQLGPLDPINCNTGTHVISSFAAFRAKLDHYKCLRWSTGQRVHLMISENPAQHITKKTQQLFI